MTSSGLTADAWLSGALDRPAFRLDGDPEDLSSQVAGLGRGPVFVYTRVPAANTGAVGRLEALGFRVVDLTIPLETVSGGLPPAPVPSAAVRHAVAGDRAAVTALALRAFSFSRFHLDPRLPAGLADRTRSDWVEGYFAGGRGNHMVVAERNGEIAGFLLLLGPATGVLTIDLIAAVPELRRQGLAAAMIGFATHAIAGVVRLRVGTQAANVPSLRLYEGLGFRVVGTQYVLHLHHE